MDIISELPDALLLKILSFLPARQVVATMVLSKRWQPLWMMVPKLRYDDASAGSFPRFVDRSLLLHEAPVIETLHFKLGQNSGAVDIGVWTRTALKRCVRKLIIKMDPSYTTALVILPRSLYTGCSMLVKLNVDKVVFLDVTSPISFPSLKKLSLKYVIYPGNEFVQRLLSDCPVLESLVVKPIQGHNVTSFTIKVPSLKSLVLRKYEASDIAAGFVIEAPSLESFEIYDINEGSFCVIESHMPNVVEANIECQYALPVGTVFSSLVYLEILTYNEAEWLTLLMRVLKDSPNLRALKLVQLHYEDDDEDDDRPCWSEPSSVPECVKWSLETLEWTGYDGAEELKEVIAFILRNANRLKRATIHNSSEYSLVKNQPTPTRNSRCVRSCRRYPGVHLPVSLHSTKGYGLALVISGWRVFDPDFIYVGSLYSAL